MLDVINRLKTWAILAWWLGARAQSDEVPASVSREVCSISRRHRPDFDGWLYRPADREPSGAWLLIPGLHFAGPADPRMDRLARILAACGHLVLAPFLPDFLDLMVRRSALADTAASFRVLLDHPRRPAGVRPAVFSISFGSLLALSLGADKRLRSQVGALVLFGGYADFEQTIRFSLTGRVHGRRLAHHDPLNQPVVFMNVLEDMPDAPAEARILMAEWRRYIRHTWGRDEMKNGGYLAVAERAAQRLPAHLRRLFCMGCGVAPGGLERVEEALRRKDTSWLNPGPLLGRIRAPVHLFHGRDDDVIPYTHAHELAAALPKTCQPKVYLTGIYGHTGGAGLLEAARHLPELAMEVRTMARMLKTLARCGQQTGS